MAIKVIYSIFLGLLVALFIGLGISAFYPSPEAPKYPIELRVSQPVLDGSKPVGETAEQREQRLAWEKANDEYNEKIRPRYERNVSIIAMVGAIIVLTVSMTALQTIKLLSDGLLLGGVLSLLYAIVRGFMGKDNLYSFVVVSVGLVVALVLGYLKFIRQPKGSKVKD